MKFQQANGLLQRWLFIFISVFLFAGLGEVFSTTARPIEKGDAYQVIALVNQVRAAYGLPELQANSALMAAAQGHSDYQASIGTATHSGKGGSSPLQRAMAAGYGGGAKVYVSENIYSGNNASPSQAVNWWTGDGIHLQTMINPNATDAGAGVAQNGEIVYYTLLVGYVAGSPGNGSVSPPSSGGTRAPTPRPYIPIITSTPNADGSIVHVVQPGQALWNIAAIYKVPLADLLSLNGLTESSFIYPGDKILIRPAESTPTATLTEFPTPTLTPTQEAKSSTATLPVPENTLEAPVLPTPIERTSTQTAPEPTNRPTRSPQSSPINLFPILIAGLFLTGGALILIGTLARPRR